MLSVWEFNCQEMALRVFYEMIGIILFLAFSVLQIKCSYLFIHFPGLYFYSSVFAKTFSFLPDNIIIISFHWFPPPPYIDSGGARLA